MEDRETKTHTGRELKRERERVEGDDIIDIYRERQKETDSERSEIYSKRATESVYERSR